MPFARVGRRSRPSIKLEGVERWTELTSYGIKTEEGDRLHLTDPLGEQVEWLEGEAYQSTQSGSLWRFAREHSGEIVSFRVAPHGNTSPTEDAPHYVGRVTVGPRPDLGGDTSERHFLFSFSWRVLGAVEEVTE